MKKISMAYGKEGLTISLPEKAIPTIIRKRPLPIPANSHQVIIDALNNPIQDKSWGQNLVEFTQKIKRNHDDQRPKSACILICDITRPVPNHLFLKPMIEQLIEGGIALDQITVLVATGLHRPNLGAELAELVSDPWVLDNIQVVNHYALKDEDHIQLGHTKTRATPVGIDRRFMEADVKIATGLVEPHFMAGYSGGRKVIAPGVAHHTTIRTFHSARFMEDIYASSCNLNKNPLHEEQLEILKMIDGPILAMNTVLDEERNLVFASFGEVIQSHLAAVDFVKSSCEVSSPRKYKTIVTSAAGYPLDKTYYQTVKGMVTPLDILEPGGRLIIVSDCSEGMGSKEFCQAQEKLVRLGPQAFLETLTAKLFADIDEWQTEMQMKTMRVGHISLYSNGLEVKDYPLTGVNHISNITEAIANSIEESGDQQIAIIPEGPYVVPFHRPK